jgi:hypothetical protein
MSQVSRSAEFKQRQIRYTGISEAEKRSSVGVIGDMSLRPGFTKH